MLLLASAWVIGPATAGPLLLPDPDDMGPYRCKDHPVLLDNDVEIGGDFSVSDASAGEPIFPSGAQSDLLPYATSDAIKKASKGKGLEPLPAVTSLATNGEPVRLACNQRAATDQDYFKHGCKKPRACDLLLRHGDRTHQLGQRDEVGAQLADPRIDSPKEALGLVALLDPSVFLPVSRTEVDAWLEIAAQYKAVEPRRDWVAFETHEEGFVVRAPRKAICGCAQDVVRRAWWVSKDGRTCQLEEMPVPLAVADEAYCVED